MSLKPVLIACTILLLTACVTPAPETLVPSLTPSEAPRRTPTPAPTATATPTPEPTATPVPYLATVLARGKVTCGLDPTRPDLAGFDADVCRAIAAALFDDPAAIDLRPIDSIEAAAALAAAEIDVYLGPIEAAPADADSGPLLFVDAVSLIARNDVGISQISDLKYATVCLIQDSVEERTFDETAQANRVRYQPFLFNAGDDDAMYSTYDEGRCDAVVDNRIRLAQRHPALSAPREQALIDLALPIGRRGALTSAADANWVMIVDAVRSGLIRAEELGVTSSSLEKALAGDEADVRHLLGVEGGIGASLGLTDDFVARAVRHVGNYGEVYTRSFGSLPRGPNALANDGGQLSAGPLDSGPLRQ